MRHCGRHMFCCHRPACTALLCLRTFVQPSQWMIGGTVQNTATCMCDVSARECLPSRCVREGHSKIWLLDGAVEDSCMFLPLLRYCEGLRNSTTTPSRLKSQLLTILAYQSFRVKLSTQHLLPSCRPQCSVSCYFAELAGSSVCACNLCTHCHALKAFQVKQRLSMRRS